MSNKTIAAIADIASFFLMRWGLGWGFFVSLGLSIGVYFIVYALLQKSRPQ